MHWILEFTLKHRNFCSLLLTSILSFLMISGTKEQQASTARVLSMSVFYPLQVTITQITTIRNIFAENRRLRQEVVQLGAEVSLLQEKAAENSRLRGMLNISQEFSYDFLPARVIARDPSEAFKSIVISAGAKDGVQKWMPIVGEKGVVGKVVQVMNNISLVQILRDPVNRTSVMVRRTRTIGILETLDGQKFFVRCRSHEEIQVGDTVTTSGLGGIYPSGLQVGTISKISESSDPLFKKAWVKLSVDFDHTEELFVMRLSPQWASFRNEFDSLEFEQ